MINTDFTQIYHKQKYFTAVNGGEDERYFLVLFDMFIYSINEIYPAILFPALVPLLVSVWGFLSHPWDP